MSAKTAISIATPHLQQAANSSSPSNNTAVSNTTAISTSTTVNTTTTANTTPSSRGLLTPSPLSSMGSLSDNLTSSTMTASSSANTNGSGSINNNNLLSADFDLGQSSALLDLVESFRQNGNNASSSSASRLPVGAGNIGYNGIVRPFNNSAGSSSSSSSVDSTNSSLLKLNLLMNSNSVNGSAHQQNGTAGLNNSQQYFQQQMLLLEQHNSQHSHHQHSAQQGHQQPFMQQQQCGICGRDPMLNGKTLVGCLHSFCQICLLQSTLNGLSQIQSGVGGSSSAIITCPVCGQETLIPSGGIDALMPHYSNPLLYNNNNQTSLNNNGNNNSNGFHANEYSIFNLPNTTNSGSSSYGNILQSQNGNSSLNSGSLSKMMMFNNSNNLENNNNGHHSGSSFPFLMDSQSLLVNNNKNRQTASAQQLQQFHQSRLIQIENDIQKTYGYYIQALTERRDSLLKELNGIVQFVIKQNHAKMLAKKASAKHGGSASSNKENNSMKENDMNHLDDLDLDSISNDSSPGSTNSSSGGVSSDQQLQLLINNHLMSIEFVSNFNSIQASIRNTFGYIRFNQQQSNEQSANGNDSKAQSSNQNNNSGQNNNGSIGSSTSSSLSSLSASSIYNKQKSSNLMFNNSNSSDLNNNHEASANNNNGNSSTDYLIEQFVSNISGGNNHIIGGHVGVLGHGMGSSTNGNGMKNSSMSSKIGSTGNKAQPTSWSSVVANATSGSNNSGMNNSSNGQNNVKSGPNQHLEHQHSLIDSLSSSLDLSVGQSGSNAGDECAKSLNSLPGQQSSIPQPAKSNIKRAKMIYNCKFGEFGVAEGQFTEPSGVCINAQNDIIVADTNSHRIQIFDSDGRFKFKFGECGKREGQLLYPNRVAVVRQTGDIVVTERSPTHQIQIYNHYGQFLRKFGANILQHPRGVCVDSKNRIVVVECKVMRVIIFDLMGNVLHKFNCAKYLEFPNGCCCSNQADEIYISDNRAHCIKVFNYEGQYLRQIGGEGLTNYPIGVGINANGEVLVADNHNNFNLTVFTPSGELITALESKVKHAQCFDVGLMDDGSIVLASKDYRIYVYRYNSSQGSNNTTGAGGGQQAPTIATHQTLTLTSDSLANSVQNAF